MSWDELFSASVNSKKLKEKYTSFFSTDCNPQTSADLQNSILKFVAEIEQQYAHRLAANKQLIADLRYKLLTNIFPIKAILNKEKLSQDYLHELQKCLCLTSSGAEIGTAYRLITADDSPAIYATGCQGDGTNGQRQVANAIKNTIENSVKSSSSLLILTGDNVYPTVSLNTTAKDIECYLAPYKNLGVDHTFVALGNHESGAIRNLPHHDAAQRNQELIKNRRDHAAAIIHTPHKRIYCHPYYTVSCIKYGENDPYAIFILYDTTSLPFDSYQLAWLRAVIGRAVIGRAEGQVILVGHHAIGPTLGKRNLLKTEEDLYGKYQPLNSVIFEGNHHRVLEDVFRRHGLFPDLERCISFVAHDHFLAFVENEYGKVMYTGGGSTRARTIPQYTLPGQKFPRIVPTKHGQAESNKKAKTGGFIKVKFQNAKPLSLEIINENAQILYRQPIKFEPERDEVSIGNVKKDLCSIMDVYLQKGLIRYLVNPFVRAGSFFHHGHKHNARAQSMMKAINDASDLASLSKLIEYQIDLIEKKHASPLLPKQSDLLAKHHQIPLSDKQGEFYEQLLKARAYLSQYHHQDSSYKMNHHNESLLPNYF